MTEESQTTDVFYWLKGTGINTITISRCMDCMLLYKCHTADYNCAWVTIIKRKDSTGFHDTFSLDKTFLQSKMHMLEKICHHTKFSSLILIANATVYDASIALISQDSTAAIWYICCGIWRMPIQTVSNCMLFIKISGLNVYNTCWRFRVRADTCRFITGLWKKKSVLLEQYKTMHVI